MRFQEVVQRRPVCRTLTPKPPVIASTTRSSADVSKARVDDLSVHLLLEHSLKGGGWRHSRPIRDHIDALSMSFPFQSPHHSFPGVTVEDARRLIGDGNAPVYLPQIQYGRMLFYVFESNESVDKLEAAC